MSKLTQRLRIVTCWLASFLRREWQPEHYPVHVREQKGVPDEARWCARILNWPGPVGLGSTRREALAALEHTLRAIAAERSVSGTPMPRPGTRVPILFASTARVSADPDLLDEFITSALGFGARAPVFISDESSLSDFGGEERVAEIRARIRANFGVVVDQPEPVLVADVLDWIREARC